MSHTQNMEKRAREREQRRRQQAADAERAKEQAAATSTPDAPTGQGGTGDLVVPAQADADHRVERPSRPQPLTPDLIPEPRRVEATGDLSPLELHDLALCERAFDHASEAQWMKGKAAHAIREGRLYRAGGRTWAEYCVTEIGESETDVNRQILEWPLAAAISAAYTTKRAVPASHVRALLPLTKTADENAIADAYAKLRAFADTNQQRVTAAALTSMVERFSKAADPLPVAQFGAAIRAIEPTRPTQAATPAAASATPDHPNLGDMPTPAPAVGSPEPANTAAAGSGENLAGGAAPAGDRPDLPTAAPDQETIEGEIVDDERAAALLASLQAASTTINEDLHTATPATLKAIAEAARHIAERAEALL
ncbi:hypothetical protein OG871_40175 (plasmid) [Kitasatospora sp. NBC_00374]|uniref:hypothetical protein n=1 Tax=Kitasatospora sp. NBC_00374 TaxID=2975964 RepID=UPI002F90EC01